MLIGQTLSHYRISAALGAGGMGEVYRATDTKLGRDVAIKVLPPEVAQDAERLGRFEREAHLLAALNHPNVAAIYGLEEADGQPFLVLELVEGEELRQRIERGAIPVDEALEIARQIAEGLEAAHDRGVVHRDLKPANVKLTPDGKVKVLDFGLARPVWSPDGRRLLYSSSQDAPTWNLSMRRADAAGEQERLATSDEIQESLAVSPDGQWLVYLAGAGARANLFKRSLDDSGDAGPVFPSRIQSFGASFSPDRRWLAYEESESGSNQIYVRPFPEGEGRWRVSTSSGQTPVWHENGEIFYWGSNAVHAVTVTARGDSLEVSKPTLLFQTGGETRLTPAFDVMPDGQHFLMLRSSWRHQISLILNWPRGLARLAAEN